MTTPPPPPATFRAAYADPSKDPYGGTYAPVMARFNVAPGGVGWDSNRLHRAVVEANPAFCNAYLGLFTTPGYPEGTTRLLHAPQKFPSVLGRTTVYDDQAYAFLDDVAGGTVTTVSFPPEYFEQSHVAAIHIPRNIAAATAAWNAAPPTDNSLGSFGAGADMESKRVPYLVYVPQPYVGLFIGRRLTPRQLTEEILTTVESDGREADMQAFVHWCIFAGCKAVNTDPASPLLLTDVVSPIADATFLEWRQSFLHSQLPGLVGGGATAATAATVRMAGLMGDMLTVQREAQAAAVAARTAAAAPKSIGEFFKTHLTTKLMHLCDVASESDLPEVWSEIAAANGKRDREAIELVVRNVANALFQPELAPVITPHLAKKLTSVRLGGTNLDDLTEGVQPFCVVIQDHTTSSGSAAFNDAVQAASDYDDVTRGSGAADLADLKSLKNQTKVILPETYPLARAMLMGYRILLMVILGETHHVVLAFGRFLTMYTNRENFYMGRIQHVDGILGPARLLRYVQLVMRAWFQGLMEASSDAEARAVPVPDFVGALHRTNIGDMAWLPSMPPQYLKRADLPPLISPEKGSDKGSEKEGEKKQTQVLNKSKNPRFDDFKLGISNTKFNDAIKKVGPPPTVTRNGKEAQMCASYHLRGVCWSNCARKHDHKPHSEAEDNQLYEWCKKAFE